MKRLALGLLLAAPLLAQPSDVPGWGKTKWGMTRPEVAALYTEYKLTEETAKDGALLLKFSIEIGHLPFDTVLAFDAHGLRSVALLNTQKDRTSFYVEDLLKSLMEKYGKPVTVNRTVMGEERSWSFPSTLVKWNLNSAFFLISWEPPPKESKELL